MRPHTAIVQSCIGREIDFILLYEVGSEFKHRNITTLVAFLDECSQMISRPYTHLVGTCCTVYANTLLETLVVLVKCTEQRFILCSDTLIGIAYHFGSYIGFSIRDALIMLDDLSLDVIQSQIDVS